MKYLLDGIETERLLFRKTQAADNSQWLEFFKNPDTHKYWTTVLDEPETECKKWYERQQERYRNNEGGMNALIEKETNKLVGHCGLLKQTVDDIAEIEIAYSLLPEFWGRGYAAEAALQCRNFAFDKKLAPSLISIISLTNIPSQKVAEKVGMSVDKTTVYKNNTVYIYRITATGG